jgi:3-dehydroquinate synthase
MVRVPIAVKPCSYDALIESGLLSRSGELLRDLLGVRKKLFVVTVASVRRRWGKRLLQSLRSAGLTAEALEMPEGERHKRLASVEKLAEELVRRGADRDSALIAFGGGVVGDVVGMLASVYMRGIDLVQIPTTVQAQVDAAIGGKTGVNLVSGKNLLGTYHQPRCVLIDPEVLSTLPERQFRAGLYESLKAGIIGRPELFSRIEQAGFAALRRDSQTLEWVIAESVKLKAEVVSADERENGLRRVLNLGHTIGHALEADTAYRHFLHGEAVAWGMIAASEIASSVEKISAKESERIAAAVLAQGRLPKVASRSRSILGRLQSDKKTRDGVVHFILPTGIGKVEVVNNVPAEVVLHAVNSLRRLSK